VVGVAGDAVKGDLRDGLGTGLGGGDTLQLSILEGVVDGLLHGTEGGVICAGELRHRLSASGRGGDRRLVAGEVHTLCCVALERGLRSGLAVGAVRLCAVRRGLLQRIVRSLVRRLEVVRGSLRLERRGGLARGLIAPSLLGSERITVVCVSLQWDRLNETRAVMVAAVAYRAHASATLLARGLVVSRTEHDLFE